MSGTRENKGEGEKKPERRKLAKFSFHLSQDTSRILTSSEESKTSLDSPFLKAFYAEADKIENSNTDIPLGQLKTAIHDFLFYLEEHELIQQETLLDQAKKLIELFNELNLLNNINENEIKFKLLAKRLNSDYPFPSLNNLIQSIENILLKLQPRFAYARRKQAFEEIVDSREKNIKYLFSSVICDDLLHCMMELNQISDLKESKEPSFFKIRDKVSAMIKKLSDFSDEVKSTPKTLDLIDNIVKYIKKYSDDMRAREGRNENKLFLQILDKLKNQLIKQHELIEAPMNKVVQEHYNKFIKTQLGKYYNAIHQQQEQLNERNLKNEELKKIIENIKKNEEALIKDREKVDSLLNSETKKTDAIKDEIQALRKKNLNLEVLLIDEDSEKSNLEKQIKKLDVNIAKFFKSIKNIHSQKAKLLKEGNVTLSKFNIRNLSKIEIMIASFSDSSFHLFLKKLSESVEQLIKEQVVRMKKNPKTI